VQILKVCKIRRVCGLFAEQRHARRALALLPCPARPGAARRARGSARRVACRSWLERRRGAVAKQRGPVKRLRAGPDGRAPSRSSPARRAARLRRGCRRSVGRPLEAGWRQARPRGAAIGDARASEGARAGPVGCVEGVEGGSAARGRLGERRRACSHVVGARARCRAGEGGAGARARRAGHTRARLGGSGGCAARRRSGVLRADDGAPARKSRCGWWGQGLGCDGAEPRATPRSGRGGQAACVRRGRVRAERAW
jgi:hypothetical protein